MPDYIGDPQEHLGSLSIRDLVEARDFIHKQLMRKQYVVGTALGRYRLRKPGVGENAARTLSNSEIVDNSWPSILVFVSKWIDKSEFGHKFELLDYIPPSIEMPDGRIVPICVIEAASVDSEAPEAATPTFPNSWIGGGYPVIADVQGEERMASIGGMLTDGHLKYALTNRHVAGNPGEIVYSVIGGEKVPIGRSSENQLSRMPFEKVYPGWPGKNVFVQMDIGLIEVEDATRWTAQIYGIGKLGHMVDLSTDNISLRLLDCRLRAYGCGSGQMIGKILGLLYRYKAVNGSEYVADFLIGPDGNKPLTTRHGDSGTLWLLESAHHCRNDGDSADYRLMPLAVQWGGHVFGGEGGSCHCQPYTLATSLSSVCRILNIDFVRDWNIGHPEYWGAVGHYTIAGQACEIITDPKLQALMKANLSSITFPQGDINEKQMKGLSKRKFVPLADVPDMVWKVGPHKRGGMNSPEHSNHFADMDKKDSHDQTLLELCEASEANISTYAWLAYYNDPKVKDESKGLLPFRCWQIYDEMVASVEAGDAERFVCAAGILSHYVGDACQPLHISYMFNGDPADTETVEVIDHKTGEKSERQEPVARGVHSAYEDVLVNFHTPEILGRLQLIFHSRTHGLDLNERKGFGAAKAVIGLMQQTFKDIQPADIVKAYVPIRKNKSKEIAGHLWDQFGEDTVKVMAAGARTLAMLWDSAWKEGKAKPKIAKARTISPGALKKLYINPDFLHSYKLDEIGPVLKGHPKPARAAKAKRTAKVAAAAAGA